MLQKYLSRVYPGILTSLTVLAILWLTLAPHPLPDTEVSLFEHADKVVHALMFGGLVLSIVVDRELYRNRQYQQTGRLPKEGNLRSLLVISLISIIFGGVIELLQAAMAMGRGCDAADFLADAAGVVLFASFSPRLAVLLLHRR